MNILFFLLFLILGFPLMGNAGPGLCRATATPPSWSEGKDVPCSENLQGETRTTNTSLDNTNAITRTSEVYEWETVAASQIDQVLGSTGAVNDVIARIVCTVNTSATSTVSIKTGSGSSVPIIPANTAIGVYPIFLGLVANDVGWKVTTAAGVTCIGMGYFQ